MKIVIIGGGFAGINLTRQLSKKPGIEITVVDKNNYQPAYPLRSRREIKGVSTTCELNFGK